MAARIALDKMATVRLMGWCRYVEVGFYDQQTGTQTWEKNSSTGLELVRWPKGKPPPDRTIIEPVVKTVAMTLYVPMVAVSILGIILAIILMAINNKFNYRRIIQHSHPSCNNLILAGNILCLLATIPLGINSEWVSQQYGLQMLLLRYLSARAHAHAHAHAHAQCSCPMLMPLPIPGVRLLPCGVCCSQLAPAPWLLPGVGGGGASSRRQEGVRKRQQEAGRSEQEET